MIVHVTDAVNMMEIMHPLTPELFACFCPCSIHAARSVLTHGAKMGHFQKIKNSNSYIPNWLADKYPDAVNKHPST